jgi:phosphohistidine phosphatase
MKLFVLRHAIAEDRADGVDSQRALTDEGRRKLGKVLAQACQAGLSPDFILTSPYVRARQTAEAAANAAEFEGPLVVTDKLLPFSSPLDLWDELREYKDAPKVLIVGHDPQLTELVCMLAGAPGGAIPMKKAAIACFHLPGVGPRPQGTLAY